MILIIKVNAHENGGRPPLQTWEGKNPPAGYAVVPSGVDVSVFWQYNGFVNIETQEIDGVNTLEAMSPNVEAWEAWSSTSTMEPEIQPIPEDGDVMEVTYDEMASAIMEGVNEV